MYFARGSLLIKTYENTRNENNAFIDVIITIFQENLTSEIMQNCKEHAHQYELMIINMNIHSMTLLLTILFIKLANN